MNPQIMVIEDEAVVAEDIRESLGELGYTVTAFSGEVVVHWRLAFPPAALGRDPPGSGASNWPQS